MKVIMISTDSRIWEESSQVRKRMREYAGLFEKLVVIVVGREKQAAVEEGNLKIEAAGSRWRLVALWRAYGAAWRVVGSGEWVVSTQDLFETGVVGWLLRRRRLVAGWQAQVHTDFLSPYFKRESWKNAVRVWIARRILPKADGVRAVSERIKRSLIKIGVAESKISVLPIFVPEPEARARKGEYILILSRLTKEKNLGMAIEAMAQVLKEWPEERMMVVGEGGERETLESKVKSLKLKDKVVFKGWQEETGEWLVGAKMLLVTSNYEGYGMAAIEAVRVGVPVVMTEVGVAGEIVKDGENGLVVPVGDSRAVAEAMKKILGGEFKLAKTDYRFRSKKDYLERFRENLELM